MSFSWVVILRLLLVLVNLSIKVLEAIKEQKLINLGRKIERETIRSQETAIQKEANDVINKPVDDEKTRKRLEDGSY